MLNPVLFTSFFFICFSEFWKSILLPLFSMEWPNFKSNHYGRRSLGMSWERELGTRGTKKKNSYLLHNTYFASYSSRIFSLSSNPTRGLSWLIPSLMLYGVTESYNHHLNWIFLKWQICIWRIGVVKIEGDPQTSSHLQARISDYGPSTKKKCAFLGIPCDPPHCIFHYQINAPKLHLHVPVCRTRAALILRCLGPWNRQYVRQPWWN